MEESTGGFSQLATSSRQIARRLLTIGENRLQLLSVEVQEERERLLRAFLMALGAAVFALLAGMTLTAGIVVLVWPYSHTAALMILTLLFGAAAAGLCWGLSVLMRDWESLPASQEQLRKDRDCVEKMLA